MKERPILFSAPMVRAILAGTKTQTRRAVKPQPTHFNPVGVPRRARPDAPSSDVIRCPYGQPGDRLWVRETWRYTASSLEESRAITEDIASGIAVDWRATYIEKCMKQLGFSREDAETADDFETWRSSIHMPRWASRITLEVTGVRVERLQDISEADAIAEGVHPAGVCLPGDDTSAFSRIGRVCNASFPVARYAALWESINGVGAWGKNPLVWVIEFRRVTP